MVRDSVVPQKKQIKISVWTGKSSDVFKCFQLVKCLRIDTLMSIEVTINMNDWFVCDIWDNVCDILITDNIVISLWTSNVYYYISYRKNIQCTCFEYRDT
jgi:3-methyladenine DNA glycosylase AlkD